MDHLQSDIESLETEKGELREKLKALNKKTLYDALSKSSPLTGKGGTWLDGKWLCVLSGFYKDF